MEICIAGFYFDKDFLNIIPMASRYFPITIISHKNGVNFNIPSNTRYIEIPNVGLEFNCYNYYLQNLWCGDNILFMHDDIKVYSSRVFHDIASIKKDCAYIFRDKAESKANGGKHGRAIFCSKRFLTFVKDFECNCEWCKEQEDIHHNKGTYLPEIKAHKGFWYDPYNTGHIAGKPPVGIRHYNSAIYHFHWFLGRIRDRKCGDESLWPNPKVNMDVVNRLFFNDMAPGRRNNWSHIKHELKRYGI